MKKFLSIVLALMLAISPTVWAIPSIQSNKVENAQEKTNDVDSALDIAELNATIVKPGLNMLTGTTKLLTAEDANASVTEWTDAMRITEFNAGTAAIVDNPNPDIYNTSKKAYSVTAYAGTQGVTGTTYPGIHVILPTTISSDRPIYTSVKTAKVNTKDHVNGAYFWVLGNTTVGTKEVNAVNMSTNSGWKSFNAIMNYTIKDSSGNLGEISSIKLQHTDNAGNVNPTTYYFDDLGFFPAYKITYCSADGSEIISTDYAIIDDNGNIITSYVPKTQIVGDVAYTTWAEKVGGDAVKSISLNNEDIVLYSVDTSVPLKEISATKYGLGEIGSKSELSVVLGDNVSVNNNDIKWSVSGSSVELSNSTGLKVTAEAIAYGSSVITAEIQGYKKSVTITVAEPVEFGFDTSEDTKVLSGTDNTTIEYVAGGSVKISSDSAATLTFTPNIDVKCYPDMVIRAKAFDTGTNLVVSYNTWSDSYSIMSGIDDYNETVIDLSSIVSDFSSNASLTFSLDAGSSIEIDSITFYPEFDAKSYLSLDVSATYLSGTTENVTVTPVITSNITHVDKEIVWTVTDPDNVAKVETSDAEAVISSNTGTGVITVTATLAHDNTEIASAEIYVTDVADVNNTIVTIETTADEITEDAESITITAKAYSKIKGADNAVVFSYNNDSLIRVVESSENNVVLEAMSNGTLVVTAKSIYNSDITADVSIDISNQREKYAAFNLRYLATGNSFLYHDPFDGWPWEDPENGVRGMAASRVENDYFHKTQYYLTNNDSYKVNITSKILGGGTFETYVNTERTAYDYLNHSYITELKSAFDTFKPNIFTIQLAENVKCNDETALALFYDTFYGFVAENKPEDCIVVVITLFGDNNRSRATIEMANKYGFLINDMTFVNTYNGLTIQKNPYYAFMQYPDFDPSQRPDNVEFRSHPSDIGMDAIAKGNVEQINKVLTKSLTPEYIYLPVSLEIDGDTKITSENGTAQLSVIGDRNDVDTTVTWSVDNENIATISDDGILKAVNNGTVLVKAVSVYDANVFATKEIQISGQTPCYTVNYAAGAEDETITGLPQSYTYAKGEFVLSTVTPTRKGYKFAGWSLSENGAVTTTVTVTSDTTVYAVWTVADNWTFDVDGNFEGITIGAFNTSVKDGVASGISFEGGLAVVSNDLILDSSKYEKFRFITSFASGESDQNLTVVITTTSGEYVYKSEIKDSDMNEYEFSVANLDGSIIGFEIRPSMLECSVAVDEIEFVKCPSPTNVMVTTENTVINGNGGTYYISNLIINKGTILLKNGVFVIDNIIGDTSVIATENANIITDVKIDGYTALELESKQYESNTRYIQINGITNKMMERSNKLGIVCEEETVVSIIEKDGEEIVSVNYYLCENGNVTALDELCNSNITKPGASIRTDKNTGIRFRASVTTAARKASEHCTVTEYGFIVARKDKLDAANAQLTIDFKNIVSGAAYVKNDEGIISKDCIYEINDDLDEIIFTGVVTNIPSKYYTYDICARPYMKIKTANATHIVYGDVVTRSIYDVAMAVLANQNNGLTDEEVSVLEGIINSSLPDDETFFPAGDLFG